MARTDTPFATRATAYRITGPAACGKTAALVNRIGQLLQEGAAPEEIGVFVSTADARDAFAHRLQDAYPGASVPKVRTVLDYQLELLDLPQAKQITGCDARVMLRFEENIFLEDLKTCGVQPKRLSEMLQFLYKSSCDLEKMDTKWFYNNDEENAFTLLKRLQRYYRAYVSPMVAPTTYAVVRDFPEKFSEHGFSHVLVDDYQTLSKASQCLLGLIAKESITVAGDAFTKVTSGEEYPFPAGLAQFETENPGCICETLQTSFASQAVVDVLRTLGTDEAYTANLEHSEGITAFSPEIAAAEDATPGATEILSFGDPKDELNGVARKVNELIAQGFAPEDIAIATPKPIWERNIRAALTAAGISVSRKHRYQVAGDVRSLDKSFEARVVTLLKLAANPEDPLAIRCWCGFGDYLANSAFFLSMLDSDRHLPLETISISVDESRRLAAAEKNNPLMKSATEASAKANTDALYVQQTTRIVEALRQAREMLSQLDGLTGETLLRTAAQLIDPAHTLSPAFLQAFGQLSEDADAAAVVATLQQQVINPRFSGQGVRVGSLTDFMGLSARVVILAGMVNGFIPNQQYFDPTRVERDKRPALLAAEAAKVIAAAGKAQEQLHFTYFTAAPLMETETLRLKAERVRFIDGRRICEIHPSETIRALTGVRFND